MRHNRGNFLATITSLIDRSSTEFRANAWSGFLAKFQPRLAAS